MSASGTTPTPAQPSRTARGAEVTGRALGVLDRESTRSVRLDQPPFCQLFAGYAEATRRTAAWDEAMNPDAAPRSLYTDVVARFAEIGDTEMTARQRRAEAMEEAEGITFRVSGQEKPHIFPMDLFPRIIDADTWQRLSLGLEQRARALNLFLDDVYGPQRIVEAGLLESSDLERSPGYVDAGRLQPPGTVRANICGMDLVCADDGRWLVLEDNLRVPSGIIFSHFLRSIEAELFGDGMRDHDILDPHDAFPMLRETLLAALPENAPHPEDPKIALVSMGESDSAWFEHRRIAEFVGMPVCTPDQLAVIDGHLHHRDENGNPQPLDVVYVRIEKDQLFSASGFDGKPLGPGLEDALAHRRVAFANAFGNGVGDDKAIYAVVPEMIRFYLGEEPLLDQVPTDVCHKPGKAEKVIGRLSQAVVKPVDGYGGAGITIGPECTDAELEQRAEELRKNPEHFIAQEIVRLSTLPTYGPDADGRTTVHPRHVDLRAFVHVRPTDDTTASERLSGEHLTAHTVPAALTRTAAAGSLIVNTSRGGGGKDTWIMRQHETAGASSERHA